MPDRQSHPIKKHADAWRKNVIAKKSVPTKWTSEDQNHLIVYLAKENSKAIAKGVLKSVRSVCNKLDNSTEKWAAKRRGRYWCDAYSRRRATLDPLIKTYSATFLNTTWHTNYTKPDIEPGLLPIIGLYFGGVHQSLKHHIPDSESESEKEADQVPSLDEPEQPLGIHLPPVEISQAHKHQPSGPPSTKPNLPWTPQEQYLFIKYLATENFKAISETKFIDLHFICTQLEKSPDLYPWACKRSGEAWFWEYKQQCADLDPEIHRFSIKYFKTNWRPHYSDPDNDKSLLPLRGHFYGNIHHSFRKVQEPPVHTAVETSPPKTERSLNVEITMDRARCDIAEADPGISSSETLRGSPPNRNISLDTDTAQQPSLQDRMIEPVSVSDEEILSSFSNEEVGLICREGMKSIHPNLSVLQNGLNSIILGISGWSGFGPHYVKDVWFLAGDLNKAKEFLALRKPCDVTS